MLKGIKIGDNRKRKLLILIIVIVLVAIILGSILIRNVIVKQGAGEGNYRAGENSSSTLIANNIKKGITIGGITGTLEDLDTSDATATEADILKGKTAYVDGKKITGTYVPVPSTIKEAMDSDYFFENTTTIADDNGKDVTIPKGFEVADNSNTVVDEGIVITDGTNEFVWVPVDDPSTMFEEATATLTGVTTQTKVYSKLRLRSQDVFEVGVGSPGINAIREPDVLSTYDTNEKYYKDILGFNSTKEMADSFVAEYKAMSDSVKKYHGFYIGRYELTGTEDKPTVKSGEVLTADKVGNWYGLYKACQNVIKNNSDVKSTMIYGCQWDETMSWLKNTKFKGQEDKVDSDSSSWGVYSGDGGPVRTGSVSRCEANEIFDLAGNYQEWTQEACSTQYRMYRGGKYDVLGSSYPAADRTTYYPQLGYDDYSARVTLYIS